MSGAFDALSDIQHVANYLDVSNAQTSGNGSSRSRPPQSPTNTMKHIQTQKGKLFPVNMNLVNMHKLYIVRRSCKEMGILIV